MKRRNVCGLTEVKPKAALSSHTSALNSRPCGVVAVGRTVTWAAAGGPGGGAVDHAERIGPERIGPERIGPERIGPERCGWELLSRP